MTFGELLAHVITQPGYSFLRTLGKAMVLLRPRPSWDWPTVQIFIKNIPKNLCSLGEPFEMFLAHS